VYRGTDFQHQAGAVWASETNTSGGPFEAALHDSAEFFVKPVGNVKPMKSYGPHVQRNWNGTLASVADGLGNLALSVTPADRRVPSGQSGLSVQTRNGGTDQQWETWNWDIGKDAPFTKYVFIHRGVKGALQGLGNGSMVVTSPTVNAWSIWKEGAQAVVNNRVCYVYVSMGDQDIGLNVKGDAPYEAGDAVILWTTRGAPDNMLWDLC
jgi:hypothetical protein